MEHYLLDTCIWIEYFHQRHGIKERVDAMDIDQICASEITIAELNFGALNSGRAEQHSHEAEWLTRCIQIYPISEVLNDYAELRYALKRKGKTVGNFDLLIGATARHYGLTLVTDNTKDFEHMPGVKVTNWVERK